MIYDNSNQIFTRLMSCPHIVRYIQTCLYAAVIRDKFANVGRSMCCQPLSVSHSSFIPVLGRRASSWPNVDSLICMSSDLFSRSGRGVCTASLIHNPAENFNWIVIFKCLCSLLIFFAISKTASSL